MLPTPLCSLLTSHKSISYLVWGAEVRRNLILQVQITLSGEGVENCFFFFFKPPFHRLYSPYSLYFLLSDENPLFSLRSLFQLGCYIIVFCSLVL